MTDWFVSLISNALKIFCEKMQDLYNLLTIDPVTYRGGELWDMSMKIFMALLGVGFTILMISAYLGLFSNLETIYMARKPEVLFTLFGMVTICGGLISIAPELLLLIVQFGQGLVKKATGGTFIFAEAYQIPNIVRNAAQGLDTLQTVLLWLVCLLGAIAVTVSTFTILLMAYGRIFKLYMYIAIAPLALPCCTSRATQRIGINYIKTFIVTCIEGLVIILAFMIFTAFNQSYGREDIELSAEQEAAIEQMMEEQGCTREEAVNAVSRDQQISEIINNISNWSYQKDDEASSIVWIYVVEQSFLFLLLAALIKGSEREVQKIFGI